MLKTKKYLICILTLVLSLATVLSACGGQPSVPSQTTAATSAAVQPATEGGEGGEAASLEFDKVAPAPYFITSIGQSADISMLKTLVERAGVEFTLDANASAADISSVGTLIVCAGASSKGLGAAGIAVDDELKRAEEILSTAKENGIIVIAMHLGGEARRGELSDQFSDLVFEASDYIIMTKNGDADGRYSNFAAERSIPITLVGNLAECIEPLKAAMGM